MPGIVHTENEYVIPRGRVYFDPFDVDGKLTGEIDLGNCPEVTITIATDKWEHFSAQEGWQEKDGGGPIKINRTGKITCDNFSPQNAALWMSGIREVKSQTAVAVTGELRDVIPGRQYQLGATDANPLGVRNVTGITVKDEAGTTTYVLDTDYRTDPETGRVQILESGSIAEGKVQFGYTPVAGTYEAVMSGSSSELFGALRVVSNNAAGKKMDTFLPKVSMSAGGDLAAVTSGTEPVAMDFELDVLKPANGQAIYRNGRPVA